MLGKILGLIIKKIKKIFKLSDEIEQKAIESGKDKSDYIINNIDN